MDQHKQFRLTYLTAAPHSLYTGLAWITSALISESFSKTYSIIFFIVSLSLTFPAGELIRKLMKSRSFISSENRLGQLFMLSAFTIPACYPIVYLLCKANLNYFFPAFSILVGAHYLIFVFAYDRKIFLLLAVMMILQAVACIYLVPASFSSSGYVAGTMILLAGLYNFFEAKTEMREYAGSVTLPEMKQ